VISTEGDTTITYWAVDVVGHEESHKTTVVHLSKTPPTTTATLAPPANAAGWNNADAVVILTATHPLGNNAIKSIKYTLNGAQTQAEVAVPGHEAPFSVTAEGTTTVTYFAIDKAGNQESAQTLTVKLDKTPPAASTMTDRAPDAEGWFNGPVDVFIDATDALSGLKSLTYSLDGAPETTYAGAPQVTGDGVHLLTYTATDMAGNKTTGNLTIPIDSQIQTGGPPSDTGSAPDAYKFRLVAQSGLSDLSGLGSQASINSSGIVAFVGKKSTGDGLYTGDGTNAPATFAPQFQFNLSRRWGDGVKINDKTQVVTFDQLSNTYHERVWDATKLNSYMEVACGGTYCRGATSGAGDPFGTPETCTIILSSYLYCTITFTPGSPPTTQSGGFDAVFSSPSLSNNCVVDSAGTPPANDCKVVFVVLINGREHLATPRLTSSCPNPQKTCYNVSPILQIPLRPTIADNGDIIVRTGGTPAAGTPPGDVCSQLFPLVRYSYDFTNAKNIADCGGGWRQLGRQPSVISDTRPQAANPAQSGHEIIVFTGDRGKGLGVFAYVEDGLTPAHIVRIAGEGWNSASSMPHCQRPELGLSDQGKRICFQSIELDGHVMVSHVDDSESWLDGDSFVVSFMGTPNADGPMTQTPSGGTEPSFTAGLGVWTIRVTLRRDKDQAGNDLFDYDLSRPSRILQVNEMIEAKAPWAPAVQTVTVSGSASQCGGPCLDFGAAGGTRKLADVDHRLALRLVLTGGAQMILEAEPMKHPLVFVPGIAGSELDYKEGYPCKVLPTLPGVPSPFPDTCKEVWTGHPWAVGPLNSLPFDPHALMTLYPSQQRIIKLWLTVPHAVAIAGKILSLLAFVIQPEDIPAAVEGIEGIHEIFTTLEELHAAIEEIQLLHAAHKIHEITELYEIFKNAHEILQILGKLELEAVDVLRFPGITGNNAQPELGGLTQTLAPPIYGTFLNKLEAEGGYVEYSLKQGDEFKPERLTWGCDTSQRTHNPSLFIFPYDWRQDNNHTAEELADYMWCVHQFYPDVPVDILTHSMGSLVARRYIICRSISPPAGCPESFSHLPGLPDVQVTEPVDVASLTTLNAPWLGAPKLVHVLATGQFLLNLKNVGGTIQQSNSQIPFLNNTIRAIAGSLTAAHQLAPSAAYFRYSGESPVVAPVSMLPGCSSGNPAPLTYDGMVSYLDSCFGRQETAPGSTTPLDFFPGTNNRVFHSVAGQDDWSNDTSGVKYTIIRSEQKDPLTIGQVTFTTSPQQCNSITLVSLFECWNENNVAIKTTFGDGTVPVISSDSPIFGNLPVKRFAFVSPSTGECDDNYYSHNGFLNNPASWRKVLWSLARANHVAFKEPEATPAFPQGCATQPTPQDPVLRIYGAQDSAISDSQGNSTASSGLFVGTVPGVQTYALGSQSIEYRMQGTQYVASLVTGPQPIGIQLDYLQNGAVTRSLRWRDLSLPPNASAKIDLSAPTPVLRWDSVGDGTFTSTVAPSADVSGAHVATPGPQITVQGVRQGAQVRVSVATTDTGGGLKQTFFSTDGTHYQLYRQPFVVDPGKPVWAFADDNIGNRTGTVVTIDDSILLPGVGASASPAPSAAGWNHGTVTVTLAGVAGAKPIHEIDYTLSGAASGSGGIPGASGTVSVSAEGVTTITVVARDTAGNQSDPATLTVQIDKTAPVTSARVSGTSIGTDLYNSNVRVNFSASDSVGGIGVDHIKWTLAGAQSGSATINGSSGSVLIKTDGTTTVTYFAVDKAGNAEAAHAITVSLQKDNIPPTIGGVVLGNTNANGWYGAPVTVGLTAADNPGGSGIDTITFSMAGAQPGGDTVNGTSTSTTVDTDGTTTITYFATDKAGNQSTTQTLTIALDQVPPTTAATSSVLAGASGWYTSDVTLTLHATDASSGVDTVYYTLSGAQAGAKTVTGDTASTLITAAGVTTVTYFATDKAGNQEPVRSLLVQIDKTPPTISGGATPAPNANGWNNTDVTVAFTCADAGGSGIASCTRPVTLSADGASLSATGTAVDVAGNQATVAVSGINIDKTPPAVSIDVAGSIDASGVYVWDPIVSIKAHDNHGGSGIDQLVYTVTGAQTGGQTITVDSATIDVSKNGVTTVSAFAIDKAGNRSLVKTVSVQLARGSDSTPPTITVIRTPSPNANGWNTGSVTLTFGCSDDLSGVALCPDPISFTHDGAGQSATVTAMDRAGNVATLTVADINIDSTLPVSVASGFPMANAAGWNNKEVTIDLSATDTGSGVAAIAYALSGADNRSASIPAGAASVTLDREGTTILTYFAIDRAGNTEAPHTLTVKLDLTDPTLLPSGDLPSPSTWLRAPLRAGFACGDALSGVSSCTDTVAVTREGAGQVALARAVDRAGNFATMLIGTQVDLTAPHTVVETVPAADQGGWNRGDVALTFSATDNPGGSGVKTVHYVLNGAQTGSGIASGSTPMVITAEGVTIVSYSAEDVAGNVEVAQTRTVRIDRTAPTSGAHLSPSPNASGVNASSVVLSLAATDAGSGVQSVHYRLSGQEHGSGFVAGDRAALALVAVGRTVVDYWAEDLAGNAEPPQTLLVNIQVPGAPPGTVLPPPVAPPGSPPVVTPVVVAPTPGLPKSGAADSRAALGTSASAVGLVRVSSDAQAPARLLIPSLRVAASIETVGLDGQGDVATPSRPADVAWFAGSVEPGQAGNAFIDGHLDWWSSGPAVFWNLNRLHRGDRIVVLRRDGRALEFRVTGVVRIPQGASVPGLFTTEGRATLALVTCAGAWDAVHHTYNERLAVTAQLVN
jgi:hypothetical protein